jgi:hypothetical protein
MHVRRPKFSWIQIPVVADGNCVACSLTVELYTSALLHDTYAALSELNDKLTLTRWLRVQMEINMSTFRLNTVGRY